MGFRPDAVRGSEGPGEIDYRLARQSVLSEFRKGRIARHEICDAHPELARAARELGDPTQLTCPVCEETKVVLVSYVFGPRLPAFGRCITSKKELQAIAKRSGIVLLLRRRGVPGLLVEPPRSHVRAEPGEPSRRRELTVSTRPFPGHGVEGSP